MSENHIPPDDGQLVNLLRLAVTEIENATRDSDEAVDTLTGAFTTVLSHARAMGEAVSTLGENPRDDEVRDSAAAVSAETRKSIVAFQFYDRLVQRLGHVGESLQALSDLLEDDARRGDPAAWTVLREQIKSRYTIREDEAMFDNVVEGRETGTGRHPDSDIEIF